MSRTLTSAEQKYSQLEKEGLALVFGVKKFHNYVYGHHFTIRSDHKPLLYLFQENKAISILASARIQRWALTLSAYQYTMEFCSGSKIPSADALSRLPLKTKDFKVPQPAETILLLKHMDDSLVTSAHIRLWTSRDPILSQVLHFIQQGWPNKCPDIQVEPYFQRKLELSSEDGCILWGTRVLIPKEGQQYLLDSLHDSHSGVSRMKSYARSYFWWPGLDQDIENVAQGCQSCLENRKAPPLSPLQPWEYPDQPWSRIHVDHAGPFMNHLFLVVVDAYSKWLEVIPVSSTSSSITIEKLRQLFACHGLPKRLVSDNGTAFTSQEFTNFLQQNGISHSKSPPFHPASNGLAERAVQTFKNALKRMKSGSIYTKLSRFLLTYRTTPHTTTGVSPAEMLMGRKLRVKFDLLRPDFRSKVMEKQIDQKHYHDQRAKVRNFTEGDKVYVRNYSHGPKWLSGTITDKTGPLSFVIRLSDGRVVRRHSDQIFISHIPNCQSSQTLEPAIISRVPDPVSNSETPVSSQANEVPSQPSVTREGIPGDGTSASSQSKDTPVATTETTAMSSCPSPQMTKTSGLRRSTRVRREPDRLVV